MAKKVLWVAVIAAATTYVSFHISFLKTNIWSSAAVSQ